MKKSSMISLFLAATFLVSSAFVGCGDKNGASHSSTNSEADMDVGLSFAESRVQIYEGESLQTVLEGLLGGELVTYTTNDGKVAAVDENGVITAVGVGTAVVKASSTLGRTALVEVTVLDGSMKAKAYVKLSQNSANMLVGDTLHIKAELVYNGATYSSEILWASDSEAVTVEDGVLMAVSSGSAKVTATANYKGEQVTAILIVTVNEVGVIVCPDYMDLKLYAGETQTRSVSVMKGSQQVRVENVSYAISDTSVALLSGAQLTARDKGGYVTVTANFKYEDVNYQFATDVYVYGKHNVEVYASGQKDRTIRGKVYGDTVTLELLNPEDGRAVKCWYINGEKLDGNVFKMTDGNVVATAIYVNQTGDDFADKFTKSQLINDSTQGSASFVYETYTDKNGASNTLGGYVKVDTPNWSSVQFHFDEGVKVTSTAKVVLRIYVPSSALLIYIGAGDYNKALELYNIETPSPDVKHKIKIANDQWIDVEIPLSWFAELDTILGGFSICASSNSYCLIDSINVVY